MHGLGARKGAGRALAYAGEMVVPAPRISSGRRNGPLQVTHTHPAHRTEAGSDSCTSPISVFGGQNELIFLARSYV